MAENSTIVWTDNTFNPWIGCTKVSAACDNCYAEAWAGRFRPNSWGPKADRKLTKSWGDPVKWNRMAQLNVHRQRVFCASLADVFDNHKSILPEWRQKLWSMIRDTPHLDWLLLTKRPQNIARFLPENWAAGYKNVWLGVTAENQKEADRRIPHLLSVPAAVRFLSCEPLLSDIDLRWAAGGTLQLQELHWVIAGGESAPDQKRREMDTGWVRNLRDQCIAADIPFVFKQWGGRDQRVINKKAGN